VVAILTLPGWLVERMAPNNGLHVVNPKEIRQVCESHPAMFSEAQTRRLRHQMNQKCRLAVASAGEANRTIANQSRRCRSGRRQRSRSGWSDKYFKWVMVAAGRISKHFNLFNPRIL
jgi:hypothetical protein